MPAANPNTPLDGTVNLTDTTAQNVLAASAAGHRILVTHMVVTNAHATIGTKVEIRSGTTVRYRNYAAPIGGGWSLEGRIFVGEPGEAITARNVTTGADVDVSMSGFYI